MLYFTSDTHFGSQRTLELSKRPFASVEEMDKTIIENFNKILKPDDVLYHLGDFGDYDKIKYFPCPVVLVLGNYERKDIKEKFKGDIDAYNAFLSKMGFKFGVILDDHKVIHKFTYDNDNDSYNHIDLWCCHEPSNCNKESNWFNLYGHIHGRQMIRHYGMDVGVDCHHFRPVSFDDVLFYKEAIEKHYDNEVFDD